MSEDAGDVGAPQQAAPTQEPAAPAAPQAATWDQPAADPPSQSPDAETSEKLDPRVREIENVKTGDKDRSIVTEDGDTLDSLSELDGVNGTAQRIYALNARAIEDAAVARGFGGSESGRILFPGITLTLPES